jgi:hypothetical protein
LTIRPHLPRQSTVVAPVVSRPDVSTPTAARSNERQIERGGERQRIVHGEDAGAVEFLHPLEIIARRILRGSASALTYALEELVRVSTCRIDSGLRPCMPGRSGFITGR